MSLGYGPDGKRIRRKVGGRTKQEVKDKLEELHADLTAGISAPDNRYTLGQAVEDWLRDGLDGRSEKTVTLNRDVLKGPSPNAAEGTPLGAYVVLCLLTGVRTEEARALTWEHADLDGDPTAVPPVPPHVTVWRSVRAHGDTKPQKSRRTLRLPERAVAALREHLIQQAGQRLLAGELWQDRDLVFCTSLGTPLDAANVRRMFKRITKATGLGEDWAPRELRTSFASLMPDSGVPVDEIARLVGHTSSRTTEVVYRRELRPVITTGAEVMDKILSG